MAGRSPKKPSASAAPIDEVEDVTKEAESAVAKFTEHRETDEAARQGMLEEVERIMKMIRNLRRVNDYWIEQNQLQDEKNEKARRKLQLIQETVGLILNKIPKGYVVSSDEKDDLRRLESAVARLIQGIKEASDGYSKTKEQVEAMRTEVGRMRDETDKLQRGLDEATYRLRQYVVDKDGKMTLIDLITAARKMINDERKAKSELDQKVKAEKEKMDEMLDRRRTMLGILKELYNRCGDVDRLTKSVGLKSAAPCPTNVDEQKQLAVEFDRALSWLIGQTQLVIEALRAAKRRLEDAENKLNRTENNALQTAEQLSKGEETIRQLTARLNELKKNLGEQSQRNAEAKKTVEQLDKTHERETEEVRTLQEKGNTNGQEMAADYDAKSKRLRQDLETLTEGTSRLREQTSELSNRIDRSLNEFLSMKEKLEKNTKGVSDRNWKKEADIRKSNADLVAAETERKEVEREVQEYVEEIRETKIEVERRSSWRNGAKNRLDAVKAEREKEKAELERLNKERAELTEKLQSNERTLKSRDERFREMQKAYDDLETKFKQLENEVDELRWQQEDEGIQSRKDAETCPTCAEMEEIVRQLPELRREHEQLMIEKAEWDRQEEEVKREKEGMKDDVVERRTKREPPPNMFKPRSSSSSAASQGSQSSGTQADGSERKAVVSHHRRTDVGTSSGGMRSISSSMGADVSSRGGGGGQFDGGIQVTVDANIKVTEEQKSSTSLTAKEEGYDVDAEGNENNNG